MSFWSSFTNSIASVPKFFAGIVTGAEGEIAAASGSIGAGAIQQNAGGQMTIQTAEQLQQTARDAIAKTIPSINEPLKNPLSDVLLKGAVLAEDKVISPYIMRPLATAGLLTDLNSPLYHSGEYEKGFQLTDIVRAYNRSEQVSTMQALTQSDLTPIKGLSSVVLGAGGIDVDKIDLWDDKSIKATFHDNVVGKWFTGIGDFVISNVAIPGEVGIVADSAKAALRGAGLLAREKTVAQMAMDIQTGFEYADTLGASGKVTNISQDVIKLAASDDMNFIVPLVRKYSNNERLPDIIGGIKDRDIVRDLILADKGDLTAMDRLTRVGNNSHLLGDAADVPAQLAGKLALEKAPVMVEDIDPMGRLNKAFDDAIASNPEMAKIKNALIDPATGGARHLGNEWAPAEPIIAREALVKTRGRALELGAAATVRDFRNVHGFAETILGGNGFVTRFVTLPVTRGLTSRMPVGIVKFNGIRPFDVFDEVDGMLDNLKLFQNGGNQIRVDINKTISAAEYRSAVKRELAAVITDPAKLHNVLDTLDSRLGQDIARTMGESDMSKVKPLVDEIKANTQKAFGNISKNGYAIDARGNRILITAETQQQLRQSFRFSRWDIFEQEVQNRIGSAVKAKAQVPADIVSSVYKDAVKIWSFDALARPSFIVKQSYMEPLISAYLANGAKYITDRIPSATKHFFQNTHNRIMEQATRVFQGEELKEVNKAVRHVSNQLQEAINMRDLYQAQWEAFYKADSVYSPATISQHGPHVAAELKAANNMVDNLELEFRAATKPFGMDIPEIPSIATLERRLQFLETQTPANLRAQYASKIANARSAIGKAKGEIHSLMPDVAALKEVNKKIAESWDDIDFIVGNLKSTLKTQAEVFGRSTKYKQRYYGLGDQYRMVNGQWVNIESLYNENKWGQAFRGELSNAQTAATNYAGELNVGVRAGLLGRRGPRLITDVTSPQYFEELSYLMNRNWRGDPLINRILSGKSEQDLVSWAKTEEGKDYLGKFSITSEADIPNYIRNKIGMVDRYIPSEAAQARILEGEVTSVDLQKLLADKVDRLSAIHPLDFDYDSASLIAGKKGLQNLDDMITRGISWTFQQLAKPENPLRWAFADKAFMDNVARKANNLAAQGVKIDVDMLNSLRQAAAREAVIETEKTFYTVPRPLRALFAARAVAAFPTATFNAFYRYGRLAIKNPARTAGFLHDYQGAFRSFGVDQYGNPVTDPMQAQYIVIPGTSDINIGGHKIFSGKGVRLNARSLGFLLNLPSPNPFGALPVSMIQSKYPDSEETIKTILGPAYDTFFPYGAKTSLKETFIPQWLRDSANWARSSKGKADWQTSWQSVYDFHATLVEMGIDKKMPTDAEILDETKRMWTLKARLEFASPAGVPVKVDTRPMDVFNQFYSILVQKYQSKGLQWDAAKTAAEEEFLATMGSNFPIDRVTLKGSSAATYVAPTISSYKRLADGGNLGLINNLYDLDPKLVGLLGMDIDVTKENFSLSVYNYLKDPTTTLPNGKPLNSIAPTPMEAEQIRQNNRTWDKYITFKDNLTKEALKIPGVKSLAGLKGGQQALRSYANDVLKKENPSWWTDEYQVGKSAGDKSYVYAQGLSQIISDPNFMNKYGKSQLWNDVKVFMAARDAIVGIYNSLPEGSQQKTNLKVGYQNYIADTISQWHPQLQKIINRYFDNDTFKAVR